MKESTLATKVMVGVLCVGVLLYLGLYFVLGWQEDLVTVPAYQYQVDMGTQAEGLLVREEAVIQDTGGYVDLILAEGEKAAKGDAVAMLYSDPAALDARQQIRTLESEIQQLDYALSTGTQSADAAKLDASVISSIVSLRRLAASGDLSALEDSALNLRTMVFRRDFTYGDTQAANQISLLIEQKESQLATLNLSLSQISRTVYAPVSGVFSGETDGFEGVITPDMLPSLTIGQLRQLLTRPLQTAGDGLGKLITDATWYLAALFEGENIPGLREGQSYTVSFSHDYYGAIDMELERIEVGEGSTLAIFSAASNMADTTLLRLQTVDIITQQLQGIRIPRKALRVITQEVPADGDGSQTQQVNSYGVYTVVGSQAEWQEVNILYTDDDFYLVEPVDSDAASRLRPGDEVILSTSGIYDGKVVR